MAYATPADFIRALKEDEGVDVSNPSDVDELLADVKRIQFYLDRADGEIHTEIGGRYVVPIAPSPDYLNYACVVIARKQMDLYINREKVRQDYEDVIAQLRRIADRRAVLIGADNNPVPERGNDANLEVTMSLNCI